MPRKGAIIFRNIVGKLAVLRIECDGVAHNGLGPRVAREDLYHLATNVERAPSIVRKAMPFCAFNVGRQALIIRH